MLSQAQVNATLLQLGPRLLKPAWALRWTPERPTTGYCYLVSEVVWHFASGPGSSPYSVDLGAHGVHWFVQDGERRVDLTANQYSFAIPYDRSRFTKFRRGRFKGPRGTISERGAQLARLFGLIGSAPLV